LRMIELPRLSALKMKWCGTSMTLRAIDRSVLRQAIPSIRCRTQLRRLITQPPQEMGLLDLSRQGFETDLTGVPGELRQHSLYNPRQGVCGGAWNIPPMEACANGDWNRYGEGRLAAAPPWLSRAGSVSMPTCFDQVGRRVPLPATIRSPLDRVG
jgi:hypothetical protein